MSSDKELTPRGDTEPPRFPRERAQFGGRTQESWPSTCPFHQAMGAAGIPLMFKEKPSLWVISTWFSQHAAKDRRYCPHHQLGAQCHVATKGQLQDETSHHALRSKLPSCQSLGPGSGSNCEVTQSHRETEDDEDVVTLLCRENRVRMSSSISIANSNSKRP